MCIIFEVSQIHKNNIFTIYWLMMCSQYFSQFDYAILLVDLNSTSTFTNSTLGRDSMHPTVNKLLTYKLLVLNSICICMYILPVCDENKSIKSHNFSLHSS